MNEASDPEKPAKSGPSAWDSALRLLGVRARSRHEMAERLTRKGFDADTVAEVMSRLDRHQLLDDEDFAAEWVRSRSTFSGKGSVALRHELRAKGIDEVVIAGAIGDIDSADEREAAAALVDRKLTVATRERMESDPAERDKVRRRLIGMLIRRGYPQSVAFDVVAQALTG
ncbi:regulatory protein RecX [Gordonia sp. ABSL1-1]|uniref:regulatory protein RecX n=1 Tax=Gordonia sp. ABSL1-1 TaxID=3053923 RepID=UPI0025722FCC|nr:regulatory protein RecX [Gordonia sp. ABSL1-1]MDL9936351.1 regulatory protein RecX [Gordonia sp. ABSL1-1]